MIAASALLHQYQRDQDDQGRLLAAEDDYRIAADLLHEPLRRLLWGGLPESLARFFERLGGWFKTGPFTTREATSREETSRSSVYSWLHELHKAGALEQVEEPRGRRPATWRITFLDLGKALPVLPDPAAVFG
jgi:hypothetical protein